MPTITSIATAVPAFSASQEEVKAAFRPLFPLDGRRLDAAMALFDNAEVSRRHSVLSLQEIARTRTLTETMAVYAASARELGQQVARACLRDAGVAPEDVDLVITVSCTGVMIPSLDAYLMDALGMRRDLRRLPITELGCLGGAAAVAGANDYLLGAPRARALVIAVELPSLSLQRLNVTPGNLVSSAIFGDGAAAVLMAGDAAANRSGSGGSSSSGAGGLRPIRVVDTLSHTIPESQHALGFDLHEDGFHPVLAKEVPALLRANIGPLVERLLARGREAGTAAAPGAFVMHPGGKKVLGAVEEALGLRREDTQPSWDVLRECGNQSSAAVLFVLERWMRERRPAAGTVGVLAAFGPGLTAELSLLEWA